MPILAIVGALMMLVGSIWLIITAVQTGANTQEKVIWALVNFFCQPIGGIVFYFMKKQGLVPLILVILGTVLYGAGAFSAAGEVMQQMPK
jgi:hypothetical protein